MEVLSQVAQRPTDSFFLSAWWVQACLDSWQRNARFRVMELGDSRPVWALLGQRTVVRHGILRVRVLALNQSAIDELDQAWIERNGFYGGKVAHFGEDLAELLDRVLAEPDWDELRLGGLMREQASAALALAASRRLHARIELDEPVHWVDLQRVRDLHSGDYLAALSANTRQQLRRARRLAESELGELRLDEATSSEEALDWFDRTAPLHRARWAGATGPGGGSGFDNPQFVGFHRRLIRIAFEHRGIQFLRLSAGSAVAAYLYNLVSDGHVHFYLSGIDYRVAEQARPGMLAHWLAIERNLQAGHRIYDFLAGDAQYKRSLATASDRMLWLVLQRRRWWLQAESVAKRLKRAISGRP